MTQKLANPRAAGYPSGLGLSEEQVDDLTDFLENALYDPALVKYDPRSSTDTLQPNEHGLTYSKYRPDLAALGAKDGFMFSGLAIDDNDRPSRRDEGLEFLDITPQLRAEKVRSSKESGTQTDTYRITNARTSVVDTHLLIIAKELPDRGRLENASEMTSSGDPYIRVFLRNGVLQPGQSIVQTLVFTRPPGNNSPPADYSLGFLSGQGHP